MLGTEKTPYGYKAVVKQINLVGPNPCTRIIWKSEESYPDRVAALLCAKAVSEFFPLSLQPL